jgi:hypothetical protein
MDTLGNWLNSNYNVHKCAGQGGGKAGMSDQYERKIEKPDAFKEEV